MISRLIFLVALCTLAACSDSADDGGVASAAEEAPAVESAAGNRAAGGQSGRAAPLPPEPENAVVVQQPAYGEAGDRNLLGYMAMPEVGLPPYPGVIVIHERRGLDEHVRAFTRRLAGEGYIVLAIDLYGGEIAETASDARDLMAAVAGDPVAVLDNIRQAQTYLREAAFSPSIAVLGWALGGGWAFQAALEMPGELDAAVMYYGQFADDRAVLERLDMPMLGLFAENDNSISAAEVRRFRATLGELGKEADVFIFSDVGHGFANPDAAGYDAEAAEDAWRRSVVFLEENLR